MSAVTKTEHPHIERHPGVCGGNPVIERTRIPVRLLVAFINENGLTIEEIREAYPFLSLAQIYDALSYYHDHQVEIDESGAGTRSIPFGTTTVCSLSRADAFARSLPEDERRESSNGAQTLSEP